MYPHEETIVDEKRERLRRTYTGVLGDYIRDLINLSGHYTNDEAKVAQFQMKM